MSSNWCNPRANTPLESATYEACKQIYPEFDIVDFRAMMAMIITAIRKEAKTRGMRVTIR